jgi:hypothetical protein
MSTPEVLTIAGEELLTFANGLGSDNPKSAALTIADCATVRALTRASGIVDDTTGSGVLTSGVDEE